MGRLAQVTTMKKGRDYASQAIDVVLDTVDAEDRAWLLEQLQKPWQEVTAATLAQKIMDEAVPEYAPQLDFLHNVKSLSGRVRDWRSRNKADA